ncbi:MAG TPA: hypothetical protein VE155_15430 [Pseudonocardiaceae bacterium]|jgi:hypothetical protein|nr:hypothetical protein [Pseudonocardiaceae bacterium]
MRANQRSILGQCSFLVAKARPSRATAAATSRDHYAATVEPHLGVDAEVLAVDL